VLGVKLAPDGNHKVEVAYLTQVPQPVAVASYTKLSIMGDSRILPQLSGSGKTGVSLTSHNFYTGTVPQLIKTTFYGWPASMGVN